MCAWKKTGGNGEDYKEAARAEAIRMRDDIVNAIKVIIGGIQLPLYTKISFQ